MCRLCVKLALVVLRRTRSAGPWRTIWFAFCVSLLSAGPARAQWGYPITPYVPGSYANRTLSGNHLGEDVTDPARGAVKGTSGAAVRAIGPGIAWTSKVGWTPEVTGR